MCVPPWIAWLDLLAVVEPLHLRLRVVHLAFEVHLPLRLPLQIFQALCNSILRVSGCKDNFYSKSNLQQLTYVQLRDSLCRTGRCTLWQCKCNVLRLPFSGSWSSECTSRSPRPCPSSTLDPCSTPANKMYKHWESYISHLRHADKTVRIVCKNCIHYC